LDCRLCETLIFTDRSAENDPGECMLSVWDRDKSHDVIAMPVPSLPSKSVVFFRAAKWAVDAAGRILFAVSLLFFPATENSVHAKNGEAGQVRIFTVFDNYPFRPGLQTDWGFAALVATPDGSVLFDTGADGAILLSNMKQMKLDPMAVRAVVISHVHRDHLGGLQGFLAENGDVTVHIRASFPGSVRHMITSAGAQYRDVKDAGEILSGVYTTGPLANDLEEQALVVDTSDGLVIITGCAHPGIVRIVETVHRQQSGRPIALVMGGFHLMGAGTSEIARIVKALRRLGVKKVAPSHCTGDAARRAFEKEFGDDYIAGGLGRFFEFP
jgi:7,8-dihydropterin-6-yl-methyl-4-(beta-D-ribofuranosyl)aminobenzene 5'-phosphate synthase